MSQLVRGEGGRLLRGPNGLLARGLDCCCEEFDCECPECALIEWDIDDGGFVSAGSVLVLLDNFGDIGCEFGTADPVIAPLASLSAALQCRPISNGLQTQLGFNTGASFYSNGVPGGIVGPLGNMPFVDGFPYSSGVVPVYLNGNTAMPRGTASIQTFNGTDCDGAIE